jgi:pimeloyl-ACP methyl ester carboxylesterase
MPSIETRAGRVAYFERGEGTPIVLLHATLHDHRDYDPIIPALARSRRVIAVDWPGHGDSPAPAAPLEAGGMLFADALVDLVEGLELAPAVIIGNSVGGYAAASLAIGHPRRVAALVLVNTGGFVPMNPLSRACCRALGMPWLARRILPRMVGSYMKARSSEDRAIAARAAALARTDQGAATGAALWRSFAAEEYDLRTRGAEVHAPTLIVWGAADTTLPLRIGRATAARIPGSRLESLDAGHVVFSSLPDEFLGIVEPFIARACEQATIAAGT